jgi:RimJ/RimL family protein N-acetyltransferase
MNRVELEASGEPIGICGLRARDIHDDVEIGFAILARHRRHGYALEAARAVTERAGSALGLQRLAAIVDPQNRASIELLEKLGFERERSIRMTGDGDELDFLARPL